MELIKIDRSNIDNPAGSVLSDLAVAIGNFDGLHRAHMTLLDTVKNIKGLTPSVFTFDIKRADCLTTLEEKLALMEYYGIERVFLAHFDALRLLSCEEFVGGILKKCACRTAVCGFNFRFGRGASGDSAALSALAKEHGMDSITLPACLFDGTVISSSEIRKRLALGNCSDVISMSGRPFFIEGVVEHGYSEGKRLVPTLNVAYPDKACPAHGVYITMCECDGRLLPAVSNVGFNPTLRKDHITCETNLLFDGGDYYGKSVRIFFLRFLRHEKKFENLDALKSAILSDVDSAVKFHTDNREEIGRIVPSGLVVREVT